MKNFISCVLIFFCFYSFSQNKAINTMTLEGLYQGKNIFVKNTYGPGGIGYCINSVKVNGNITTDKINSDVFQIELSGFKLKVGEKIKIEMFYYEGCTPGSPMVLNPGALAKGGTDKETSIVIEGVYKWQNLFVSCALLPNGKGNGIKQVLVNDELVASKIEGEIFEIDLVDLALKGGEGKLKEGDKIKIEFKCHKGFGPLLINPEAINKL